MQIIPILLVAAAVFGICYLVDKAFTKKFRSKQQHMSGLAVRANKMYGIFGVLLIAVGVMAIVVGIMGGIMLLIGGIVVLVMGAALAAHYLSFGIFYDGETFLVSSFGKKSVTHSYKEITEQKLYVLQGGSVLVELYLEDGTWIPPLQAGASRPDGTPRTAISTTPASTGGSPMRRKCDAYSQRCYHGAGAGDLSACPGSSQYPL